MKSLINKILVVAGFSVILVSCSKEEVKPFNSGSSVSNATNMTTRNYPTDGTLTNMGDISEEEQNVVTEDPTTTTTTGTGGDEEGGGITDGGSSSDYDSKGSKRKPGRP